MSFLKIINKIYEGSLFSAFRFRLELSLYLFFFIFFLTTLDISIQKKNHFYAIRNRQRIKQRK